MMRLTLVMLLIAGAARAAPMTETQCHEMEGEFIPYASDNGLPACAFGAFTEVGIWREELSDEQIDRTWQAFQANEEALCNQSWRCWLMRWFGLRS